MRLVQKWDTTLSDVQSHCFADKSVTSDATILVVFISTVSREGCADADKMRILRNVYR